MGVPVESEIRLQPFSRDALHAVVHAPVAAAAEDALSVDPHHQEGVVGIRQGLEGRRIDARPQGWNEDALLELSPFDIVEGWRLVAHACRLVEDAPSLPLRHIDHQFIGQLPDAESDRLHIGYGPVTTG
jgi:hypothetical protein